MSEGCARSSRLVTILVMAAMLPLNEYGLAMLALASHELIRTLTRIGAGTKVVQCRDASLQVTAANAYVLNWLIALAVAASQYSLAPYIASYYQAPELASLLQIMALSYCLYPLVAIRACWVQRSQNMKRYSFCSAAAVSTDNLATALLLLGGVGMESIAYAKILAAFVWVLGFVTIKTPSFGFSFDLRYQWKLIRFSSQVLLSELLRNLRNNADLFIAGKLLGPEVLGLYAFAKSAGVGLAQSLSNAYLAGLYPKCAEEFRTGNLTQSTKRFFLFTAAVALIFLLQAVAAPIYVPILFNSNWAQAGTIVTVLCLSAGPALFLDTTCLIQRVQNRLLTESLLQLSALVTVVGVIFIAKPNDAMGFAVFVTSASLVWLMIGLTFPFLPAKYSALPIKLERSNTPRPNAG